MVYIVSSGVTLLVGNKETTKNKLLLEWKAFVDSVGIKSADLEDGLLFWWRANAQNVITRISLRRPNYFINTDDKTKH